MKSVTFIGKPYHLPPEKANEGSESEMEYGMNIAVSDILSLDREIKDTRLEECRHWNYPADLPKTSVIIVFHNEGKEMSSMGMQLLTY